jgi:hypothetical protein
MFYCSNQERGKMKYQLKKISGQSTQEQYNSYFRSLDLKKTSPTKKEEARR